MPRPSRNLDRALLAAGRMLLPQMGCAGLTIRAVADAAGVNIGMFHYHFRTREAFLRAVLQQAYEEMYARLTFVITHPRELNALESLRHSLRVLGRFLRDNRTFIARVVADALAGDEIAREFMKQNMPRHLGLLAQLVKLGQREKLVRKLPVAQAVGICAGALAAPILFGGAIVESGALTRRDSNRLAADLLSDAAIDARIDIAIAAIGLAKGPGQ